MGTVLTEKKDSIFLVTINRPEVRNAVDRATAQALADAFRCFEEDPSLSVLILTGAGGCFCAGADLKALGRGEGNRLEPLGDGPMGPTRMFLSKPSIAAIAGYAVAGGLELALLCDLRVAERDSVLGVFCRRWGVPLVDGGTVRLPRLIGLSRALDLILTGRPVGAEEAFSMGLVNRLADKGKALEEAIQLARYLAAFPQTCLRNDRRSVYECMDLSLKDALSHEFSLGMETVASGEPFLGARKFSQEMSKKTS